MSEPARERGLFRQRTALAWNRTALALAGVAAVGMRTGARRDELAPAAALGFVLALAAGLSARVRRSGSDMAAARRLRLFQVVTGATVVVAAASLGLVLL